MPQAANTTRTTLTEVTPVQHIDGAGTVGGVTLNTALDKTNDSITAYPKACVTVNLTASGQILAAPGTCVAIEIVSFTTGATVRLSDALTATTPYISSAITLTLDGTTKTGHKAGDEIFKNIVLLTGGYVTISGTCEIIAKVIAA